MDSKLYLTLVNYADGHETDVAGHGQATGLAVWERDAPLDMSRRPTVQIVVSTTDGRIMLDVKTSDRRVNVRAWGQTVCPGSYGQAGNVWTDNGSYAGPLGRAIVRDHPSDDNTTDDITYALQSGFVATAAWLLVGATECPSVDVIAECLDLQLRTLADEESDAWHDWHASHSVECDHCGSFNYADDVTDLSGGPCGNCAAQLTVLPEDDGSDPE